MGRVMRLCLACVTWLNPAGAFQDSEGDTATIDSHSATYLLGTKGMVVLPSPLLRQAPHTVICCMLGLCPLTCSLEKLFGFALTLQTSQVNCFAQLTTKGSIVSEGRSVV